VSELTSMAFKEIISKVVTRMVLLILLVVALCGYLLYWLFLMLKG
jgi:hypothetical protein